MKKIFYSVEINSVHMKTEFDMVLESLHYAQPPEPKRKMLEIPGTNGMMDLSESLTGYPLYGNRTITMGFGTGHPKKEWPRLYSDILDRFHNQKVKLIFDDDPGYYYLGRAKVGEYERFQTLGKLVIEVDADPYKYELLSGLDDWLWDPFSFVDGVIRKYRDLAISGNGDLVLVGSPMPVILEIIVSGNMKVTIDGKTYSLRAGTNRLYDVIIRNREYTLKFAGQGTVSINYRGGRL